MPFFGGSPFDSDVERATSDTKTEEDWSLIIEICDKINQSPSGPKEAMKSLMKRLKNSSPRVVMHTLSLLGACVDNCGKSFQLEMCTRDFYDFAFGTLRKPDGVQVTLSTRFKELIQDWVIAFEGDSRLGLMKKLYVDLKSEGIAFKDHNADKAVGARSTPVPASSSTSRSQAPAGTSYQDDIDLARAIELSLQEAKTTPTSSGFGDSSMYPSLYPSISSGSSSSQPQPSQPPTSQSSKPKVRALYDFDAAEDNELSFKAGELINIIDESDENWWRGETLQGSGLFPATFVTSDLSATPEPAPGAAGRSVHFSDEANAQPRVEISEEKISLLLEMLHTAAEDNEQEETTIKELEVECESMKPMIKHKIDANDREWAELMKLNEQFQNALRLYQQLMKEGHAQPQQAPPMYAYPDGAGQTTMYETTSAYQPSGYAPVEQVPYQVPGALSTNAPPPSSYSVPTQPPMHAVPPQQAIAPPASMAAPQGVVPPGHGFPPPVQGMPPGGQPGHPAPTSQPGPYYAPHDPVSAVTSDAMHSGSPRGVRYDAPPSQPPPVQYYTPEQQQQPPLPSGLVGGNPPPLDNQGYDMAPPGTQPVYYYGQAAPTQHQPPPPVQHQPGVPSMHQQPPSSHPGLPPMHQAHQVPPGHGFPPQQAVEASLI